MYIVRQGGQHGYKGHILNLSQDIQTLLDTLPPSVTDLPILVLRQTGANDSYSNFTVRRQKVLDALLWLQRNNPFYKSTVIDHNILQQLPENGVPQEIFNNTYTNTLRTHSDVTNSDTDTEYGYTNDMETNHDADLSNNDTDINIDNMDVNIDLSEHNCTSFIPTPQREQTELESIHSIINNTNIPISWPPVSQTPLSEFDTEGLATMAFPTLFPYYGTGDPTTNKSFEFKNSWGCRPRTQITWVSFLGSEEPSLKLLRSSELQHMNSSPISNCPLSKSAIFYSRNINII